MRSSPAITLFHELPESYQPSSSFAVSILFHVATLGLLCAGLMFAPQVKEPVHAKHETVRYLNLHTPESLAPSSTGFSIPYPHLSSTAPATSAQKGSSGQPLAMRQKSKAAHSSQTLLQPDISTQRSFAGNLPLPRVIIWNAAQASAKKLRAPLMQKQLAASATPSLQQPNEEKNLADTALSASNSPAHAFFLHPGNTSPLALQGRPATTAEPITTTMGSAQSTSAAVISLSDLHMAEGTAVLPPVNQVASSGSSAGQRTDKEKISSGSGSASAPGITSGTEAKQSSGSRANSSSITPPSHANPAQNDQLLATHIELPKEGRFGAVIIGSSMEARYPETARLWGDRLAYTVYLHVGLAKSWILQYSLPRAEFEAPAGGTGQIEAPWPYNIVRPYIAPGSIDEDAVIVHGIVNQAGRFKSLSVAYPPQFAQTQFVLASLAQWQFRPARVAGKNTSVEIVLIIPVEQE